MITIDDPRLLEPTTRALREGVPCQITVLASGRQWLQTPSGEEIYAIKVRVDSDGSEFQVNLPVPATGVARLVDGRRLPARRLTAEPSVVAIDWSAALSASSAV